MNLSCHDLTRCWAWLKKTFESVEELFFKHQVERVSFHNITFLNYRNGICMSKRWRSGRLYDLRLCPSYLRSWLIASPCAVKRWYTHFSWLDMLFTHETLQEHIAAIGRWLKNTDTLELIFELLEHSDANSWKLALDNLSYIIENEPTNADVFILESSWQSWVLSLLRSSHVAVLTSDNPDDFSKHFYRKSSQRTELACDFFQ